SITAGGAAGAGRGGGKMDETQRETSCGPWGVLLRALKAVATLLGQEARKPPAPQGPSPGAVLGELPVTIAEDHRSQAGQGLQPSFTDCSLSSSEPMHYEWRLMEKQQNCPLL